MAEKLMVDAVVVWAREKGCSEEKLLRALIVSNLVTVHQKTGIGRLSAFCGAVCAGRSNLALCHVTHAMLVIRSS